MEVHSVPKTNVLPVFQFADTDQYTDTDFSQARVGLRRANQLQLCR